MDKVIAVVQGIISREMDEYGKAGMGLGVGSAKFQEIMAKVELLARAHAVIEEHQMLTRTGRQVINRWLYENIEGVHPTDISEAADRVFDGDLEVIGGLYMLVQHSHKMERIWEDLYDTEWEDQIVR